MPIPRTLLTLALLAGCNGTQGGITKFNNDPVATITSHADGDAVDEGFVVTLRGTIADDNDAAADLVATWYSGADELCATAPVASDGTTVCEAALGLDDTEIVLEGQDDDNASGTARVSLVVNATGAPTATITAPTGEGALYADVPVRVEAVVGDAEDAAEDLVVAWTDGTGASLAVDEEPDGDGLLTGSLALAEGDHTLTLTVTDTTGKVGEASVEVTVGPANTAPTCAITAPADGASAALDTTVTFAGVVTDADVGASALSATWTSDLDGELATGPVGDDGAVTFDTDVLSFGTHVVTLEGVDDVGAACSDTITFSVGAPPAVVIDAPADGEVVNEGDVIAFLATVSDDGSTPDALALAWESDRDGLLDATPADPSGLVAFDADGLSIGEHVVTLSATDADGLYAEASVSLRVNGLPGAPGVSITPASASTADALVASVTTEASDPEGDPVAYTWAWTVDGAPTAFSGDTVPAAATTRGEVWTVTVTPDDGWGEGAAGSASVTVGNSAPTLADVTLSPDPAREGETLACAPGAAADADGDAIAYSYAWTVNGVGVAATGSTLGDTWWSSRDVVVCQVTPNDGTIAGAAVASNAVTIGNTAPSLASVAITPASPDAGDTLGCVTSGAEDADGDSLTESVVWTVDGVEVSTAPFLAPGDFAGGDEVVCTATVSDGEDTSAPVSASVTIANSPPVLATVSLTPTSPTESDTLTCAPGATTDADGATAFTYTYAWTIGGATIAATGPTLDGDDFDKGDVVRCRATPNDGVEDGEAVASGSVTVANSPPVATSVTLSPSSPDTDDTIAASVSATDIDGDTLSYTYAWYVDAAAVAATGATLAGSYFSRGDTVYVVVTPSDGAASGAAVTSSTLTVVNSAPSITAASITPDPAYAASTLTCATSGYADADGDAEASTYAWTVDGVAAGAGATLSGAFSAGDVVTCTATPSDGAATGAARSDSVTIAGTAPVLASVSLTPTTAYEASTLTCTPGVTTDADGTTSFTYTYAWTVNGSTIAPTTSTLTGTYFSKGNTVACRATPSDGSLAGAAVTSSTVTIANTAPVSSAATISPATAYEGTTLTCAPSATDADGDTVSWSYAWYVNGSAVAATSSTLTGAYFSKGNTVYCRATPNDGAASGTAVSSSTRTISNSAPGAPVVAIDPADPEAGLDPLWCEVTTAATDADGDALTYTFAWTRNGSSYTGVTTTSRTGDTIPAAATDADDTWVCSVTASDGSATSSAATDTVDVLGELYYVGRYSEYGSATNVGLGYLFAQSVTLSAAADLYTIGIIFNTTNTSNVKMAVYTNSAGAPGTLLGYTDAGTGAGAVDLDVTSAPVTLAAGAYWIVWIHDGGTYGRLKYTTSGCSTNTLYYKASSYATAFPSSFGSASSLTGQCYNTYLGVR